MAEARAGLGEGTRVGTGEEEKGLEEKEEGENLAWLMGGAGPSEEDTTVAPTPVAAVPLKNEASSRNHAAQCHKKWKGKWGQKKECHP